MHPGISLRAMSASNRVPRCCACASATAIKGFKSDTRCSGNANLNTWHSAGPRGSIAERNGRRMGRGGLGGAL